MTTKAELNFLLLAIGLLITQVFAKDFQFTLWNSSDCTRGDPSTESYILQVPRDNDDPNADITCSHLQGLNLDGWLKDTHSQQVIAYVDTLAIQAGCELVFYYQGPPADQPPDQLANGPCWQAYRRVNRSSACPSVTFNAESLALSYCCGDRCRVPRGYAGFSDPIFPPAPPLSSDLPNLSRDLAQRDTIRPPLQAKSQPDSASGENITSEVSKCQFTNSTELVYTYLPSVQVGDTYPCNSGEDLGGSACNWDKGYTTEVQLMSTQSLSVSEAIQAGLEGILTETTTIGYDGSSSITNGQSLTASDTLTLPQGRFGYPAFKQAVKCFNGTWSGCDVQEVTSLPVLEYCLPILEEVTSQASEASGIFVMVDTT
ncbi:hypothetical protein F4678DRAFT_485362 [Xylaria arbuscula]|nr:hypothetical protein F4678DRAFT_485362 [Xylaria arbuscula]